MLILQGQQDAEGGTFALYGLYHDVSAVLAGKVLTELQAEAGTFFAACAVSGLSLMEDGVKTVVGNADTVVMDTNPGEVVVMAGDADFDG